MSVRGVVVALVCVGSITLVVERRAFSVEERVVIAISAYSTCSERDEVDD